MGLGFIDIREPEDLDVGTKKLSVSFDAMNEVMAKGLMMPALPDYKGDMPPDLTALDDNQLGGLLGKIAEYCGYVEAELAKAEVRSMDAQGVLEFTQANIRLKIKSYKDSDVKLTTKDKDDLVCTDPRVVEAKSRAQYAEAIHILTKTILKRAERNWDTVSRRITQRGQDVERMKRETNIGNIQMPSASSRSFTRR
jgi:hypothetical protein